MTGHVTCLKNDYIYSIKTIDFDLMIIEIYNIC